VFRLNHFGASTQIFVVDITYQVRLDEIQLVIALIDEHALGVEQRSIAPSHRMGPSFSGLASLMSLTTQEYSSNVVSGHPSAGSGNFLCIKLVQQRSLVLRIFPALIQAKTGA